MPEYRKWCQVVEIGTWTGYSLFKLLHRSSYRKLYSSALQLANLESLRLLTHGTKCLFAKAQLLLEASCSQGTEPEQRYHFIWVTWDQESQICSVLEHRTTVSNSVRQSSPQSSGLSEKVMCLCLIQGRGFSVKVLIATTQFFYVYWILPIHLMIYQTI